MTYTIYLSNQAERFYKKLNKSLKERTKQTLLNLKKDPKLGKALHGDLKGYFSIRIGKIRIIYSVLEKDKKIYITAIGPRKTIYKH